MFSKFFKSKFVLYLMFYNLMIITAYLGCVAILNLPIIGYVKVKVLRRVRRFEVAKGDLKKPAVVEERYGFFCKAVGKEGDDIV